MRNHVPDPSRDLGLLMDKFRDVSKFSQQDVRDRWSLVRGRLEKWLGEVDAMMKDVEHLSGRLPRQISASTKDCLGR